MSEEEILNYQRILEAVPTNVPAFEALKKIFMERERWEDLAALYEDRAARLPDPSQSPDLYLQAASLRLNRLKDTQSAKANIAKVLEARSGDLQAMALWRSVATQEGDYTTVIKILRQETQLTEDPKAKAERFIDIAQIFQSHLNNKEHAAVAYHQAFLLDGENEEAMQKSIDLYKEVGEWQRVIAVLRSRLESTSESLEKARLLTRVAQAFLHLEEGQTDAGKEKAAQLYKEALSLEPELPEAKEGLQQLADELEEWSTVLKRLKREIRQSGDDNDSASLNYRIADGYYRREGKPAYAIRYCKQALELVSDHSQALELLQTLYASLNKWEALADFLNERARKSDSDAKKVMWLKKLARVYREQTKERSREIDTLERILEVMPSEEETLELLEGIYRDEKRYGKALGVMEKRLNSTLEEPIAKKVLLFEMAALAHEELRKADRAADYYEQILSIDPDDTDAIDALIPLYESQGAWEKLIQRMKHKLDRTEEKQSRSVIFSQIGDIYAQRLSLSKEAFAAYTQALRENPQDEQLTPKLESLARQIGNWSEMIELYRSTLEHSDDPADLSALLFRIGDIYDREMGQPGRARESYEEALEHQERLDVMNALQRLYRQSEDWVDLAELLKTKSRHEKLENADRIEVLIELARIQESTIEDAEGAAESYETVLNLAPNHTQALECLERIYKQTESWEALRDVYQRRIEEPASEYELKATLQQLGTLLVEKLEALEDAVQIYQQLRVLDEQDNVILQRLEYLYRSLQQWESWVETARLHVEHIRRPEQKKEVLFEIAGIQEEELSDNAGAIVTLREIHTLDASDARVLDELERLLEESGDVEGQLEILRKKVDVLEDAEDKKRLLFQMAELFRQLQKEPETAAAFSEILEIDRHDLKALRSLQAYYQLEGEHERVLNLLVREREAVEVEEKAGLTQRIAQLQTSLGRYSQAIEEYRGLLQENPEDELAMVSLQNIAATEEEWRASAYDALEPLFRSSQNWESLVLALEARFHATQDKNRRLELARELEELYRLRLGDDEKAFDWCCHMLREDFHDADTRERVESMADEMGRWDDLLQVYKNTVRTFVEPRQIVDTYLFIAEKYQEQLSNAEESLQNYRRVLDYDTNNEIALDALEVLYRQLEQWRDLVDVLRSRVQLTEEPEEKKELLFEVADLWEQRLEDSPEAIQVFNDILELENDSLRAVQRLASLYEREGHYRELAETWSRELELLTSEEEATALRYRLGTVYSENLDEQHRALSLLREVLEAEKEHTQAIIRVETLMEEDAYRLTCARILEPIYLHQENFVNLKSVYRIQLDDKTQSANERRKALMRLGLLHEEKLNEHRDAFDRYLQVFKEAPGHEGARDALLRMAAHLSVWSEFAKALEGGVSQIEDLNERVQTHLVLANTYRTHLNDADRGVTHDRKVVDDLDPKNLQAIEALVFFYNEREAWSDLIEILFQKEQALLDELEKKQVFDRIAAIYEEKQEDNNQAIQIFNQYLFRLENDELPEPGAAELADAQTHSETMQQRVESLVEQVDQAREALQGLEAQSATAKEQAEAAQLQLSEADEESREAVAEEVQRLVELADAASLGFQAKSTELTELMDALDEAELAESEATEAVRAAEAAKAEKAAEVEELREQRIGFQLDTIRSLARLFEKEERWADLVEILEKEVGLLDDDEAAIRLRFRIAHLWEEKLEQVPKAIELYRAILDDDPDFADAFDAMERLSDDEEYQLVVAQSLESFFRDGREDWLRLIQMIEIQLSHTEDKMRRLAFLKEIVELYEEEMDNTDMAFVYLCRAFREAPTDRDVISELERLAEENDAWEELVGVYEDEVESIEDQQLALRMYLKIANIYDEALMDTEEAILNYQQALGIEEHNSAALGALDRLYRQEKEFEKLVDILQRKVHITEDSRDKIALLARLATTWERELENLEAAISSYQSVLELDDTNHNALTALQRLYEEVAEPEALYDICKTKMEQVESASEQAGLLRKMANLCGGPLERGEEAISLYEQVLEIEEEDEESLSALEQLYAKAERWDDLVQVVHQLLDVVSGVERKKEFYRILGRTYGEHLDNESESIDGWQRVLELDPKDNDALSALRVIFERRESWDSLVGILRRLIPLQAEDSEKLELYLQLASIYQDRMEKDDEAIAAWRRVLELEPSHWQALETLEGLLSARNDWRSVLGIVEQKEAVVVDEQEKVTLLLRAAELCRSELREPNRSTPYYERILTLEPSHRESVEALGQIYERNQDWKKLIQIYDIESQIAEDTAGRVQKLCSIAQIYENRLFNKNASFQSYIRAFEVSPANETTRSELERIASEAAWWEELVRVYLREVDRIGVIQPEPAAPAPMMEDMPPTVDGTMPPEVPAELPPEVAMDAPVDGETVQVDADSIGDVDAEFGTPTPQELPAAELPPEVPPQVAEIPPTPAPEVLLTPEVIATKVSLLLRIGFIYQIELREEGAAIEAYQRVLELDSSNLSAINALEELYELTDLWHELIGIFDRKLQLSEELRDQKELLFRIAELQEEQLHNRAAAIEALRQIQRVAPDDDEALLGLERLYREEEQWPDLIATLETRISQSSDNRSLLAMKAEIGNVYDRHLEQPERAVESFQDILSIQADNTDALQALERLYTQLEQWDSLLEVLNREVELCQLEKEKIPFYYRMSMIWEDELQDHNMAIESLGKILEVDRWNVSAIKGLERLYRAAENWTRLIEVYEQHIRAVDDLDQMAELYFEVGLLYEEQMSDIDRAITYYQRVLDSDPNYQPALSALGRLYEAAGNWPKCIEMMEREARVANDPERLVEVYFRIGKLYEERLVQIDRAKDSYRKALGIQPSYLPALQALKVIHFLQRDWDGVIRLASQQERFTEEPEQKASISCEIAKLYRDRLANPEQAAGYYEKALEFAPGYLAAAHPLAELYIEQKAWQNAATTLDMVLRVMVEQGIAEDLFRFQYMAALAAEEMQDVGRALQLYQESYNLSPTYFPTLNGLGRIYYAQEQWERSLKVYQTILYHHQNQLSERETSEVYCRMGMAYDQMGVLEQAVGYYEQALEIDPTNPLAIRRLAAYAESQGDFNRSLELKERLLLLLDNDEERFTLAMELGALAQERLQDPDLAIDFYRQASSSNPDNTEVLFKLLELYDVTQQWEDMIDTLEQLLELEQEPTEQQRYIFNIAELYQNRLQDVASASQSYNRVLDLNPEHPQAFTALETMLFAHEMWDLMEQNYRAMLQRLPQDENVSSEFKIELWRKLGELYRYKLNNIGNAITAYETVYRLEPEIKNLEVLAELYADHDRTKAIEAHQKLLQLNPARLESYRSLVRLFYEEQLYDRSFMVCSALRFLGDVSPEEEQFYNTMKAKTTDRIKRAFREEVWKGTIFHPQVRSPLADILSVLYQFCGSEFAERTKDYKIRKQDRVSPDLFFSRTYEYVAQVLGLTGREVYQTNLFPGLRAVNTFPPVLLAGEDMFKERHPKELLFMIGRRLTYSRPEFLFASVLPYTQFRAMLSTFFSMFVPNFPVEAPPETAERIKAIFQKSLPAERVNQLQQLVQSYMQDPNRVSPEQYIEGIEFSANRAGFCLASDLKIAAAVSEQDARDDVNIPQRNKVKDLVTFSISGEYLTFRESLGLAVKL